MELKTLKDMDCDISEEDFGVGGVPPKSGYTDELLKAEAIKWFKHLDNNTCVNETFSINNWIVYFFGINEVDLK